MILSRSDLFYMHLDISGAKYTVCKLLFIDLKDFRFQAGIKDEDWIVGDLF